MILMGEPVIPELKADGQPEVTEIESVCFHCYKTGTTRLLVVKIAFFREVIISSFSCPHCGFENRSLEPAARIQNKGQRIILNVRSQKDINRRVVRPAGSSIEIPELDASFPASDGDVSTIEGIILGIADNIEQLQPERKVKQPDVAEKLQTFLERLRGLLSLERPFTFIMDDPSGNGFIENYLAPDKDPQLEVTLYQRTPEQDAVLGIRPDSDDEAPNGVVESSDVAPETPLPDSRIGEDEVLNFNVNCPSCNAPSTTRMKLVDIPHFKQVVIMATVCSECGHKDSEVKASGGISPKGRFYRLKLTHAADLSRDVLISETSGIRIPELDLESMGGTLGGRFTTLEGLLLAVVDQLTSACPFVLGDSAPQDEKTQKLASVIEQLKAIASGQRLGVTFELKDPAGNSYLQNLYAPDLDPELEVVDYDRTPAEDDDLGITDMNTTDYDGVSANKSGDAS